jgi:hypothetical protein
MGTSCPVGSGEPAPDTHCELRHAANGSRPQQFSNRATYRDVVAAVAVDQDGAIRISEARLQPARRFAAAAILTERSAVSNQNNLDRCTHE